MSGPAGPWVDTHAHLATPSIDADLANILARARAAGVAQVVGVGTTAADSARLVELSLANPGVFATAGIHPNHGAEAAAGDWDLVVALAHHPRVVGIGETGLDRHWDDTPFPTQQDYFDRHLGLARELDLPVVIHCRESSADILAQLRRHGGPIRGVLHSFTGDAPEAAAYLDLGLHISLAGMITFKNKTLDTLRAAAAEIPADRLLVETDSPYLSPHPHRGRPNEPGLVAVTGVALASIRGCDPAELARVTTANARRLFRLPEAELLAEPA